MGERVRLMGALREQCLHGPGNVSFEVSDWESHLCRQSVNCSSHSLIIQIICFCTASLTQTGYYYSGSGAESRSRASVLTIRSAGAVAVCVCVCVWELPAWWTLYAHIQTPVTWRASSVDKPRGDRYWVSGNQFCIQLCPKAHRDSANTADPS